MTHTLQAFETPQRICLIPACRQAGSSTKVNYLLVPYMKQKILFFLILFLSLFLRVYKLDQIPPSPYWEEVALGYDAYSISETLHDHHGNFLPLVAFESFGDWKPSLYFYAIVPFIKLIGLNVWAVRLPSAIAGVFIVIGVGYLVSQIKKTKLQALSPMLAMFITTISPWAIQFSRGGWEVNLATALILWGVVLFFRYLNKLRITPACRQGRDHGSRNFFSANLVYSVLLLSLSMYTYHAARVVAPLLGIGLAVLYLIKVTLLNHKSYIINQISKLVIVGLLALALTAPIFVSMLSPVGNQRFAETSIFTNISIIEESNQFRIDHNNALWAKLVSHRYLLFSREVAKNFVSHFSPRFLFISGDSNPRHSIQSVGTFYWVDGLFMIVGLLYLIKVRSEKPEERNYLLFLLYWLVVGILPASITYGAPHALRILLTLPVWMTLITFGIEETLSLMSKIQMSNVKSMSKSKFEIYHLTLISVLIIYSTCFLKYWNNYLNDYPAKYAHEWQYGYEHVISKLNSTIAQYPNSQIYFTREQGRPAMYYWFYNQTYPKLVQAVDATAKQDQGEYLEFENVKFVRTINEVPADQPAIVVYRDGELPGGEVVGEVMGLNGEVEFKIAVIGL